MRPALTAITRARSRLLLAGAEETMRAAVGRPPGRQDCALDHRAPGGDSVVVDGRKRHVIRAGDVLGDPRHAFARGRKGLDDGVDVPAADRLGHRGNPAPKRCTRSRTTMPSPTGEAEGGSHAETSKPVAGSAGPSA